MDPLEVRMLPGMWAVLGVIELENFRDCTDHGIVDTLPEMEGPYRLIGS